MKVHPAQSLLGPHPYEAGGHIRLRSGLWTVLKAVRIVIFVAVAVSNHRYRKDDDDLDLQLTNCYKLLRTQDLGGPGWGLPDKVKVEEDASSLEKVEQKR